MKKIFLLLFISSCGFKPIYKSESQFSANNQNYIEELAAIQIKPERKKINQELRNHLENVLNPNYIKVEPRYLLSFKLSKGVVSTFTNFTGSSGRNKVILTVDYELRDLNSKKIIATATTTARDDYDVEEKRFANYITEESIASNLTFNIAQNIRNLLINDIINNFKSKENNQQNP